jgi:uncharacterized CHY-type Zn-finger protein
MIKKVVLPSLGILAIIAALLAGACGGPQTSKVVADSEQIAPAVFKPVKHLDVDFDISCYECHKEMTPEVAASWYEGMHGQVNVGCFVCHGDGDVTFHPQPTVERCEGCHSLYIANNEKHAGETSCFDCHNGHNLKYHAPAGQAR